MAHLAASPEISHCCICICWIHEQVNQVSHELIQVALIQGNRLDARQENKLHSDRPGRGFS